MPGSFAYTPAAGEKLTPGVHELSAIFTPADTLNYATVSATVSLTVTEKLPALITWPAPSAISYGTALSAAQLNATASVPGTFVYTPSAGHVLAPGKYTLSAFFIPSEADKYAKAQATVELEVEGSPLRLFTCRTQPLRLRRRGPSQLPTLPPLNRHRQMGRTSTLPPRQGREKHAPIKALSTRKVRTVNGISRRTNSAATRNAS